jgi:Fe-S-cluster-containing dehydrogenase component
MPVLCNHCSDAPCIKICPGNPEKAGNPPRSKPYKALFKTPEGITLHDPELCIGCGDCQKACPYSHEKLDAKQPERRDLQRDQPQPADESRSRAGPTRLRRFRAARHRAPRWRPWPAPIAGHERLEGRRLQPVRSDDVIEKCTFCYHRVLNGLQPACVEACPSRPASLATRKTRTARSPDPEEGKVFRLQEEKGTKPNVHYIGKYSPRA